MRIRCIAKDFSICKVVDLSQVDMEAEYTFFAKTDQERSLVCPSENVPTNITDREDGWRAFFIEGVLDLSLIGILAGISGVLAANGIGLFAISTFNTDYILVKKENEQKALSVLKEAGYEIT